MTRTFSFKADRSGDAFDGGPTGGIFQGDQDVDTGENITGFTQFTFDGIDNLITVPDCYGRIQPSWNRATEPKWPPIEYDVYYNTESPAFNGTKLDWTYSLNKYIDNLGFEDTFYVGVRARNSSSPAYEESNTKEMSVITEYAYLNEIVDYYIGGGGKAAWVNNALGCTHGSPPCTTCYTSMGFGGWFTANFSTILANHTSVMVYERTGHQNRWTIPNYRNYLYPNEWTSPYTWPWDEQYFVTFWEPRTVKVRVNTTCTCDFNAGNIEAIRVL